VVSASRLLRAALLAGACALFFATHVFVEYIGIRTRLVTAPVTATGGMVRVSVLPAKLKEIQSPFAVIARIRNDAGAADHFVIQVDDTPVCDPSVAAKSTHRVDCVLNREWSSRVPHEVSIRSSASQWTLEYLEFSTHHGSSSGALKLIVLPAISKRYAPPAPGWIAVLWLVLTGILLLPSPPLPRWISALHKTIVGLFILWTGVSLLSSWVSAYSVIVEVSSFALWLVLLVAPRLYQVSRGLAAALATSPATWASIARRVLVAALVLACFGAVLERRLHEAFHGNYSGFLRLSRARIDANPMLEGRADVKQSLILEDSPGYDSQFMYAMTFDPFLMRYQNRPAMYQLFIDSPPYRYGRIGFSVLTKILSGDHWNLYPATMIKSILGALALCAFTIAVAARGSGGSALWGALIILVPGFWTSLYMGLPEPVAAAALLSGYLCVRSRQWVAAGLLFAVSILVRETGALLVVCLAASLIISGRWRVALGLLAMSIVPLILWRLYVGWVFFPEFGALAFPKPPDDFGAPFAGMINLWTAVARGQYWPDLWAMRRASLCYSMVVAGGFGLASVLAIKKPSPVTIASAGYGVMAILFNLKNVWVQAVNAERLTSDLLLTLALASAVGFPGYSRSLRTGVLIFWTAAAGYVWFGMFDAPYIRSTLLPGLW
jgi:hypothetical protein